MAAEAKTEYITDLIIGETLYYMYPIRSIERNKTEELLARYKSGIILIRITDNSKSQGAYYVASFFYKHKLYHMLITREDHDGGMGDLEEIIKRKYGVVMDLSGYTLPILNHDPIFKPTIEKPMPTAEGGRRKKSRRSVSGRRKKTRRRSTRK